MGESSICLNRHFLTDNQEVRWIWTSGKTDELDVWVYARRGFEIKNPLGARLHITADQRYLVWINGRRVGFGPPKSHLATPCVDTYPIADFLKTGANVICVLVYSLGPVEQVYALMPCRGALLAAIEHDDGVILPTDSTWKAQREFAYQQTGVRYNGNQPFIEHFDARSSLGKPWLQDYDDRKWPQATELSGPVFEPWIALERRDLPLFNWEYRRPERLLEWGISCFEKPTEDKVSKTLAGEIAQAERLPGEKQFVRITPGLAGKLDRVSLNAAKLPGQQGCYALFDFGRIWTGYPVITIKGAPGTIVDMSYAEGLIHGRLDPNKHLSVYLDRLVLDEGELTHRVNWPKGLRYLQVDVRRGSAEILDIGLEVSTYPVQRQGNFYCSDPVLNQAWEISAHTLQLCMEDSYMDTPWRERGGWLGDILPEARANYYAFGDTALIRRFLIQHARGQMADGSMCGKYPAKVSSHIPTWTLTYAFALADYLRHTGDLALTAELWPTLQRIDQWLEKYRTEEGLYGNLPLEVTPTTNIYTFIDGAPVVVSGTNAALNAYAFAFLHTCELIAHELQNEEMEEVYRLKAERLRTCFRELFWDQKRGVFVNGRINGKLLTRFGIHENVLAVLWGLADSKQERRIMKKFPEEAFLSVFESDPVLYEKGKRLAKADGTWTSEEFPVPEMVLFLHGNYPWPAQKPVPANSPFFAYWTLQMLCETNQTGIALEFIRRRWGEFSRRGGTTVWEAWTEIGSLSHAWTAAPVSVLGKYILGVQPMDNQGREWNICPNRAGLIWAQGRVPTPAGIIAVSWEWKSSRWHLKIIIPVGLRVTVGLPEKEVKALKVNGRVVKKPIRFVQSGQTRLGTSLNEGHHLVETSKQ